MTIGLMFIWVLLIVGNAVILKGFLDKGDSDNTLACGAVILFIAAISIGVRDIEVTSQEARRLCIQHGKGVIEIGPSEKVCRL